MKPGMSSTLVNSEAAVAFSRLNLSAWVLEETMGPWLSQESYWLLVVAADKKEGKTIFSGVATSSYSHPQ